jgi:hypothetical protein
MYQPYPSGGQAPEPQRSGPQRPEPPAPVLTAVKLMYAGAAVSAIGLITSLLTIGSIKTAIRKKDTTLTAAQLHTAENVTVAVAVIIALIGIGLWIWMAQVNKAGKNWARITSTVFFGLDTVGLLISFAQPGAAASRLITIVLWLIGLSAIIMLWRKESSAYFKPQQV